MCPPRPRDHRPVAARHSTWSGSAGFGGGEPGEGVRVGVVILLGYRVGVDRSHGLPVVQACRVGEGASGRVYLAGAILTGANLAGAGLIMADLADAYMVDANLCQAYLSSANLAAADLAGADLTDAVGADISHAVGAPSVPPSSGLHQSPREPDDRTASKDRRPSKPIDAKPSAVGRRPGAVGGPLRSHG
jgi:hypothetical protein